jgi:transposase InsO family protein
LGVLFARKSQTQETLKGFLRRAQNEFGLRIKKIRSDNGTEFKNSQIEGFLEEEGIKHEFSSPYTPQQNGVVERKNRTLLDMASVTEPSKSLGTPTVVLVQQTSDNPVDVPKSLDKFGIVFLTFPGMFHPSCRHYRTSEI